MKFKIPFLTVAFSLALLSVTFGQGTFRNLDFESPILPFNPQPPLNVVTISNAMPGWTGYIGGNSVNAVLYDNLTLSEAAISIHDSNGFAPILQGNYTVVLQPQYPSGSPIPAIAQSGTVPASAMSLRFYSLASSFSVSFASQAIPISLLDSTPNYNIYGGDISMFANQTGELRFTGGGYLDFIQFSSQQVPEPSTLGLFTVGALLLGWRLRGHLSFRRDGEAGLWHAGDPKTTVSVQLAAAYTV